MKESFSGGSNEESVPVSGVRGGGGGRQRKKKKEKKKFGNPNLNCFFKQTKKKEKRGKRKIANTPPGNPFLSLKERSRLEHVRLPAASFGTIAAAATTAG